jgi:hypothetical protein
MKNVFVLIVILIFVVVFGYFLRKVTKEDLANYYNVTRPTLQKWMWYFPTTIPFDEWKTRRKFTGFEAAGIKNVWGFDASMVLNKNQIAERAESNYKTLGENVKKNLTKIGLTEEAWEKLSVFPPFITERILNVMG